MINHEVAISGFTKESFEEITREQIRAHGFNSSYFKLKAATLKSGASASASAITPVGSLNTASATILKGFGLSVSSVNPLVTTAFVIGGFMLAGYGLYKLNEKVMDRIV